MAALLTETDPRVLIRGDADGVIEVARRVRVLADQGLRPVAECLEQVSAPSSGWVGGAADSARRQLQTQRTFWLAQADILDSLATAFDRYAVAIRAAQASAAHAAQAAAWARAAFPYAAAWTAYGQAATELRDAQVRLGEAADVLADAVERATEALPDDGGGEPDWYLLGRGALQVADELAAIVASGLLAAVGLGETGSGEAPAETAAALPDITLADLGALAGPDPVPDQPLVAQVHDFLTELDRRGLAYTLARPRGAALLVAVSVPGQRWEVEFGDAGAVGIEVFTSDGGIRDGAGLADLWRLTNEQ